MRCTIWYHLYNLKNVKNNHGEVLILVTLQTSACNFTKINTPLSKTPGYAFDRHNQSEKLYSIISCISEEHLIIF